MSEKGQGDSATPGTATDAGSGAAGGATAGAVPGGGGNQAEQTGPGNVEGPVDDATGTRSGWDDASARAALEDALGPENVLDSIDTSDLGKPEIVDTSEESGDAEEPDLPGGGPTDTRTGWDYPPGQDGPRGEERPYSPPGPEGEHTAQDDTIWIPGGTEFPGAIDPSQPGRAPQPLDRPDGMSNEDFRKWREAHPTSLDKANTEIDVT